MYMSRLRALGENIKIYRKAKGLSQNQLAEKLNFSREHLACVEIGKEFISLRKIFEMSDLLDVPVSKFFNFK